MYSKKGMRRFRIFSKQTCKRKKMSRNRSIMIDKEKSLFVFVIITIIFSINLDLVSLK